MDQRAVIVSLARMIARLATELAECRLEPARPYYLNLARLAEAAADAVTEQSHTPGEDT